MILDDVREYCTAAAGSGSYADLRPVYMREPTAPPTLARASARGLGAMRSVARAGRRAIRVEQKGYGVLDPRDLSRRWQRSRVPGAPSTMGTRWRLAVGTVRARSHARRMRDELRSALDEHETDVGPARPYVYFPLHYEPERTTNPEGGEFFDQYEALLELRQAIPPEVAIVVREHPTQLNPRFQGHLGRSPLAYEVYRSLENVTIAPLAADPLQLLRDAILTATVTGTAALEAACLGRRALVLGHPWFEGCPGIDSYSKQWHFGHAVQTAGPDLTDVVDFLSNLVDSAGVFGFSNPSAAPFHPRYLERAQSIEGATLLAAAVVAGLHSAHALPGGDPLP
jgi:hypothetical protein